MKKRIIASILSILIVGQVSISMAYATSNAQVAKVETKANADKKVNDEVNKVIENMVNIKSSTHNVDVKFTKSVDGMDKDIFSLTGTTAYIYNDDKEGFKDAQVFSFTQKEDGTSLNNDMVIFQDNIYTKKEDGKFTKDGALKINDKEAFDTIGNLLKPLTTYPDKFTMEKRGEEIVFTFKGTDKEIFDIVKKPFSLKVDNLDESKFEENLVYTIDAKTYFLKKMQLNINADNKMKITQNLELNMNMADEIVDPIKFQ